MRVRGTHLVDMEDIEQIMREVILEDVKENPDKNIDKFHSVRFMKALRKLPRAEYVTKDAYKKLKNKLKDSRPKNPIQWVPVEEGFAWALKCSRCGYVDRDTFDSHYKKYCPECGGMYVKKAVKKSE